LLRWLTAEGVTCSRSAVASRLPNSITAAKGGELICPRPFSAWTGARFCVTTATMRHPLRKMT
jgi:hypothetical protein